MSTNTVEIRVVATGAAQAAAEVQAAGTAVRNVTSGLAPALTQGTGATRSLTAEFTRLQQAQLSAAGASTSTWLPGLRAVTVSTADASRSAAEGVERMRALGTAMGAVAGSAGPAGGALMTVAQAAMMANGNAGLLLQTLKGGAVFAGIAGGVGVLTAELRMLSAAADDVNAALRRVGKPGGYGVGDAVLEAYGMGGPRDTRVAAPTYEEEKAGRASQIERNIRDWNERLRAKTPEERAADTVRAAAPGTYDEAAYAKLVESERRRDDEPELLARQAQMREQEQRERDAASERELQELRRLTEATRREAEQRERAARELAVRIADDMAAAADRRAADDARDAAAEAGDRAAALRGLADAGPVDMSDPDVRRDIRRSDREQEREAATRRRATEKLRNLGLKPMDVMTGDVFGEERHERARRALSSKTRALFDQEWRSETAASAERDERDARAAAVRAEGLAGARAAARAARGLIIPRGNVPAGAGGPDNATVENALAEIAANTKSTADSVKQGLGLAE